MTQATRRLVNNCATCTSVCRAIREFEERLKWLVETGVPVGAVHFYIGQEAVAVGVCAALTGATGSPRRIAATATASPRASTCGR